MNTCPRCHKPVVRSHDELLCIVHGTVYTPIRAGDPVTYSTDRAKFQLARKPCRFCGDLFGSTGLFSHERACSGTSREPVFEPRSCTCCGDRFPWPIRDATQTRKPRCPYCRKWCRHRKSHRPQEEAVAS